MKIIKEKLKSSLKRLILCIITLPELVLQPNKQIETKTQDGRRRITPIFLAPQPALG